MWITEWTVSKYQKNLESMGVVNSQQELHQGKQDVPSALDPHTSPEMWLSPKMPVSMMLTVFKQVNSTNICNYSSQCCCHLYLRFSRS